MNTEQAIFESSLAQWRGAQPLTLPVPKAVVLWQEASCTVYVEDSFGPAVPYPPIPRTDSESNHGYVRLKGNLALVEAIPELTTWPEFAELVRKINEESCPLESVGCAVGFFEVTDHEAIKHRVGAYLDIVFSDFTAAQDPEAYLRVAAALMTGVADCEKWWSSVEIGLQRLRYLGGSKFPLGLMLRLSAHGRTKEEARWSFRQTVDRAGAVIQRL
jgi:hypothetical protein